MRLSPKTHQQLETFFRHYFDDENLNLPQVEIYVRRGANLLTNIIRVDGITIGRHVFINSRIAKFDKKKRLCISKNLLSHEITHVFQYEQAGFFRFLTQYLKDYWTNLRRKKTQNARARMEAYWEIPYEIQARDAAKKFVEWING